MPEFFGEERGELDVPLTQRLVADLNAALMKSFLDVSGAEWKVVVQPDSVMDNRHRNRWR